MFIPILHMFRATQCSSSGESIVSMQHLVYITECRGPSSMRIRQFLLDLHTRRPPTQSDIYQTLYWYNWFSWWWALGCSKHVKNWNKHIRKKNCASSWLFTRIIPRCTVNKTYKPIVVLGSQYFFRINLFVFRFFDTILCDSLWKFWLLSGSMQWGESTETFSLLSFRVKKIFAYDFAFVRMSTLTL
jgi:hypothetical protein